MGAANQHLAHLLYAGHCAVSDFNVTKLREAADVWLTCDQVWTLLPRMLHRLDGFLSESAFLKLLCSIPPPVVSLVVVWLELILTSEHFALASRISRPLYSLPVVCEATINSISFSESDI